MDYVFVTLSRHICYFNHDKHKSYHKYLETYLDVRLGLCCLVPAS